MKNRTLEKSGHISYMKSNLKRLMDGNQVAENGCWEWTGNIAVNGYGRVHSLEGKTEYAHRLSWRTFKGSIPEGIFVCHHCDNRKCINPEHLFLGTSQDNVIDAFNKNRMTVPKASYLSDENHQVSKLTNEQVRFIRSNPQITGRNLAIRFNVSDGCISMIRLMKTYKGVT